MKGTVIRRGLVTVLVLLIVFPLTLLAGCNNGQAEEPPFHPSNGIDENGYWEGIRALDYVTLFDYEALPIPKEVHQISNYEVVVEIDNLLSEYAYNEEVTDRAVAKGDEVNIDYVGSIDGAEFNGGSTDGMGTVVVAGSEDYIDDFLTQIIGHMPGETFDVVATFPDDYSEPIFQGKEAVFVTTINYIHGELITPELTDDFVKENFFDALGWTTSAELEKGVREMMQKDAIGEFVHEFLITKVAISSIPEKIIRYYELSMINYFQEYADHYDMEMDEFLTEYVGVANVDELLVQNEEDTLSSATFSLVYQAIAEDMNLIVRDVDMVHYFLDATGSEDYSSYEETYGLPYLKQVVLQDLVYKHILDNVVLL